MLIWPAAPVVPARERHRALGRHERVLVRIERRLIPHAASEDRLHHVVHRDAARERQREVRAPSAYATWAPSLSSVIRRARASAGSARVVELRSLRGDVQPEAFPTEVGVVHLGSSSRAGARVDEQSDDRRERAEQDGQLERDHHVRRTEMIGLPPVTSGQSIDVQIVSAKPVAAPVSPPTSVNTRTGLCGGSRAPASMWWLGIGREGLQRLEARRAFSSWIAFTVVEVLERRRARRFAAQPWWASTRCIVRLHRRGGSTSLSSATATGGSSAQ